MLKSKIDWCDSTFNPVTGCMHGCQYCYARGIAKRFGGHQDLDYFLETEEHPELKEQKLHVLDAPLAKYNLDASVAPYPFYFEPTLHRYKLDEYQKKKKPRNIFVCSMADLFGKWVPDEWIEEVFRACEKGPQHNYLFLTKNPIRYEYLHQKGILRKCDNMWYGYSATVNNCDYWSDLQYNIFASIEPILEPVHAQLCDWAIIGVETGRRKNKVIPKREWIEEIVKWCREIDIPLFMKSSLADIWGEPLIQEFPEQLILREKNR